MARFARIDIQGLAHHVTQRGNRRETVFFSEKDYATYFEFLKEATLTSESEVLAWCLMPNHVHLIIVPSHKDGLRQTVANTHRRYAAYINARNRWTGYLWQGRFGSVVMDEGHLYRALAYVSLNPVRVGLVERAEDWNYGDSNRITFLNHSLYKFSTENPARTLRPFRFHQYQPILIIGLYCLKIRLTLCEKKTRCG